MPLPLLDAKARSFALFSSTSSRMMLESCPVTDAKRAPMLGRVSLAAGAGAAGGYCPGWGVG